MNEWFLESQKQQLKWWVLRSSLSPTNCQMPANQLHFIEWNSLPSNDLDTAKTSLFRIAFRLE